MDSLHEYFPLLWQSYSKDYMYKNLSFLPMDVLKLYESKLTSGFGKRLRKNDIVAIIVDHFGAASELAVKKAGTRCHGSMTPDSIYSYYQLIISLLSEDFPEEILTRLIQPPMEDLALPSTIPCPLPWVSNDQFPFAKNLFNKGEILFCLKSISSAMPVNYNRSFDSRSKCLVSVFQSMSRILSVLTVDSLIIILACSSLAKCSLPVMTRTEYVSLILKTIFGVKIHHELTRNIDISRHATNIAQHKATQRCVDKLNASNNHKKINNEWPKLVSQDIIFQCLHDYRLSTCYKLPPTCSCCTRQKDMEYSEHELNSKFVTEFGLELLIPLDPMILKSWLISDCSIQPSIIPMNVMLHKDGAFWSEHDTAKQSPFIFLCKDCSLSLSRRQLPRYAIANHLYLGVLPECFSDLTWVEEMACSIYRTTAHVTRLYQSNNLNDPLVYHGNTCAHEMNVISTVTALPRTPGDINSMISIIFVGKKKFDPGRMGNMLRIRKEKVWQFLLWLVENNPLYHNLVKLDIANLELYPLEEVDHPFGGTLLPGVCERVIHDEESDASAYFLEETAGLEPHPAENLAVDDENQPFIENMGVSDPDCSKMSGRSFTASALRNLIPKEDYRPDLLIAHGDAISEYNNPDLFPGMYPTLFPFGLGRLQDPQRRVKISFQKHLEYLIDLNNRSFRFHRSFIFVGTNILQRREGHRSAALAVKRHNFKDIGNLLMSLTPELVLSTASHLESEKGSMSLSDEQKKVLNALTHINTVAANIPGSHGSKIRTRASIRSYFGFFGLPIIYLTLNPSAAHSPIFQVMAGEKNIDLSSVLPREVDRSTRAYNLAHDPVAGADFFDFCVHTIFEFLFGWDTSKHVSKPSGGILGHVKAFFGTAEYTERANLHGHFLIWLTGAPNPSELHKQLLDPIFQERFFKFFDSTIFHELPDIEFHSDKLFEPRVQRPPIPPNVGATLDDLCEWSSVFTYEVKACGEILQRHTCRRVCHKYGNTDSCRFLFPHEIVEKSWFDPDTNSVFFLCRDSTVNYYSPYLLVFCRHNHDIKCILSGKAAKAAMFYITDYITKMDIKTYEMLSLMSKAVAQVSASDYSGLSDKSPKTLIHKCLAQFSRQQQIHGQQAARYIRDKGDSIQSHKTIPMLSSLLMSYVYELHPWLQCKMVSSRTDEEDEDDNDVPEDISTTNEPEQANVQLNMNIDGKLKMDNQVLDYIYRADELYSFCFYDFVRFYYISKQNNSDKGELKNKNRTYKRFGLKPPHPLYQSHCIVLRSETFAGDIPQNWLIPRIVGCSVPRKNDVRYSLFMLAHFKPWGKSMLIGIEGSNALSLFTETSFSSSSLEIMKNWEAIHECEDERDAERIRKQNSKMKASAVMTRDFKKNINKNLDDEDIDLDLSRIKHYKKDMMLIAVISEITLAGWLKTPDDTLLSKNASIPDVFPNISAAVIKKWYKEIHEQETAVTLARRNAGDTNILNQNLFDNSSSSCTINPSEVYSILEHDAVSYAVNSASPTTALRSIESKLGPHEVFDKISVNFKLNEKQKQAFFIMVNSFFEQQAWARSDKSGIKPLPLRMVMTGPGGTGKTHVIKALLAVMEHYGMSHVMRKLAPTGSAATLIDGMTVHKGLGIKVRKKNKGKGNRVPGDNTEDLSVLVSVKQLENLRAEYKDAEWILLDECGMLSQELTSEVDAALRCALEQPNEWFGGINIIFSGDFCQYAPVFGRALYVPLDNSFEQSDKRIAMRLGRLAWKSFHVVIELSEQKRMSSDPQYADAVKRLRLRVCTDNDADLFNSRVMRSSVYPAGIDISHGYLNSVAIVPTNIVREMLNFKKAEANTCHGTSNLVTCAARDMIGGKPVTNLTNRHSLLNADVSSMSSDGALPGFLPLYVGAPVILRYRNLSVELHIANGIQGIVRSIETKIDECGLTYAQCVIVEFPGSKVALSNLPPECFPVVPISWKFTTELRDVDNVKHKVRVTREQMPLCLGHAITGHSSQGKTINKLLTDLSTGGFGAYVAASRAQTRDGIVLMSSVTVQNLNKPLPSSLRKELKRLQALEHNTMVHYGFIDAQEIQVPDVENAHGVSYNKDSVIMLTVENQGQCLKRKQVTKDKKDFTGDSKENKKQKFSSQSNDCAMQADVVPQCSYAGSQWDSHNYSCAYDATLMTVLHLFQCSSQDQRTGWLYASGQSEWLVNGILENLQVTQNNTHSMFNNARDVMRDKLSITSASKFPRYGPAFASVADVFETIYDSNHKAREVVLPETCGDGSSCYVHHANAAYQPTNSVWERKAPECGFSVECLYATTQQWSSIFLKNCIRHAASCEKHDGASLKNVPNFLWFEVHPDVMPTTTPSQVIMVPVQPETGNGTTFVCSLRLGAIIYADGYHFTCRLFGSDGSIWFHDGQENNGSPSYNGNLQYINIMDMLIDHKMRKAYLYFYV